MDELNPLEKAKYRLHNFFVPDRKSINELKAILERQQKRKISYEEAEEVAVELLDFYQCLAGDKRIIKEDSYETAE